MFILCDSKKNIVEIVDNEKCYGWTEREWLESKNIFSWLHFIGQIEAMPPVATTMKVTIYQAAEATVKAIAIV